MNIFLIGFMGSGKSTIGKVLSQQLKMSFIDLDEAIEKAQGKKVSDIFRDLGENKFREMEKQMIVETSKQDKQVIALGGGAPYFFDNMEFINSVGLSIYLKMSANALKKRLLQLPPQARASRPLIAIKTEKELSDYVISTLEKRERFYNKAKLIVSNEEQDVSAALERIVKAIQYYK